MESGFVILIATVALILGIVAGVMISRIKNHDNTQGIIYAYCGDQDTSPSLLLEYSVPIEDITLRKRVLFDVVVVKQNSQK